MSDKIDIKRISRVDIVANERLYLTTDGRVVKEGDKDAASLLAAKGQLIPDFLAKKFKLDELVDKPKESAEPTARQTRVEKPVTR